MRSGTISSTVRRPCTYNIRPFSFYFSSSGERMEEST